MRTKADVPWVLHHVGEEFTEQRVVHRVNLFVLVPDVQGPFGVTLNKGVQHVLELAQRELTHVLQT